MVVLKKVSASTLMETMVATVLIVVIFMIASLILNNTFRNTVLYNASAIEAHLNQLEYQFLNDLINIPYETHYQEWEIHITQESHSENQEILIEATHMKLQKKIEKTIVF